MAFSAAGDILALDMDDLTGIGPYSVYPRTSAVEGNQVVSLTGGPYRHQHYRAGPGRVPEQVADVPVPRRWGTRSPAR